MEALSSKDILGLCERGEEYRVSIYMSTGIGAARTEQYPLILKSLVKDAQERLTFLGVNKENAKKVLEGASRIAEDSAFWMNQKQGLCIFVSKESTNYFQFPIEFKESVTVSNYYNILPILDFIFENKDFYILALNYNGSKLFKANKYGSKDVTSKEISKTLREVKLNYEREESKFFHIAKEGNRETTENVIFHGRGGLKDVEKTRIQSFIRQLEKDTSKYLRKSNLPLILAGTDFVVSEYKKINTYKNLFEENIFVNIDPTNEVKIYQKALSAIAKTYKGTTDRQIQKYFDLKNAGKASSDPLEILRLSYTGGIETLFVNKDKDLFKSYSEKSEPDVVGRLTKNTFCGFANLVSVLTIKNGGNVIILDEARMPEKSFVSANFRY